MDEISRLSNLLEKCNIDDIYMSRIDDEDKEGIIYGFESDEDEPFVHTGEEDTKTNIKTPPPSPKRLRTPDSPPYVGESSKIHENNISRSFKDYSYKNDYVFDQEEIRKNIPPKYTQKERSIVNGILNIDCSTNTEQLVLAWINQLKLLVQTKDETISNLSILDFARYLKYRTTGIIFNWFETTTIGSNLPYASTETSIESKIFILDWLAKQIYKEFLGITELDSIKDKREHIIRVLSNMKLCDPCYIENFFCQVRENFYKTHNREGLLEIVEGKLPYELSKYIEENLNQREKTLGILEKLAKEYRENLCIRKIEQYHINKVNIKCCKQLETTPQQFGCHESKHRKFKKRYNKDYRPRKYKTYKQPWKKKYYRRFRKQDKSKICPRGKKTCKCWKCQEIGHYANECPLLDKETKQKLKLIYSLGYEPIEENYTEGEEIDFDTYSLESTDSDIE